MLWAVTCQSSKRCNKRDQPDQRQPLGGRYPYCHVNSVRCPTAVCQLGLTISI